MGYTNLEKRKAYYETLFSGKLERVDKDGDKLIAKTKRGKKLGQAIAMNSPAHKLLVKMYPEKFPTPDGFAVGSGRLVPLTKRNPVRNMKAQEFKELGMTKTQAYKMTQEMKKNNIPLTQDAQGIKTLISIVQKAQKRKEETAQRRLGKALKKVRETGLKYFTDRDLPGFKGKYQVSHEFTPTFVTKDLHKWQRKLRPDLVKKLRSFVHSRNSAVKFEYAQYVWMLKSEWNVEELKKHIKKCCS